MANENSASYAKIGLAVVLGVVATIATLVYIGGLGNQEDLVLIETYYDKPVSGLSVGSAVNFRGVKLGEVRDISFVGNRYKVEARDAHLIYILMAIRGDLVPISDDVDDPDLAVRQLVERGLRATVSASGITGLSRIECDMRPQDPPLLKLTWKPKHPYIPSHVSLMDNFSDAATKVMNQINAMDMASVWSNIHATVEHLAQAAEGVKGLIEGERDDYEQILSNVKDISTSVRDLSAELRANPSLLIRERVHEPLPETTR